MGNLYESIDGKLVVTKSVSESVSYKELINRKQVLEDSIALGQSNWYMQRTKYELELDDIEDRIIEAKKLGLDSDV